MAKNEMVCITHHKFYGQDVFNVLYGKEGESCAKRCLTYYGEENLSKTAKKFLAESTRTYTYMDRLYGEETYFYK